MTGLIVLIVASLIGLGLIDVLHNEGIVIKVTPRTRPVIVVRPRPVRGQIRVKPRRAWSNCILE